LAGNCLGISGIDIGVRQNVADNKRKKPFAPPGYAIDSKKSCICGSKLVVKIGQRFHCNNCGRDFGEMEIQKSPTRTQIQNGWKQPKVTRDGIK
jgi:hypothetical protein